jgi:hypothetical protein
MVMAVSVCIVSIAESWQLSLCQGDRIAKAKQNIAFKATYLEYPELEFALWNATTLARQRSAYAERREKPLSYHNRVCRICPSVHPRELQRGSITPIQSASERNLSRAGNDTKIRPRSRCVNDSLQLVPVQGFDGDNRSFETLLRCDSRSAAQGARLTIL